MSGIIAAGRAYRGDAHAEVVGMEGFRRLLVPCWLLLLIFSSSCLAQLISSPLRSRLLGVAFGPARFRWHARQYPSIALKILSLLILPERKARMGANYSRLIIILRQDGSQPTFPRGEHNFRWLHGESNRDVAARGESNRTFR